MDFGGPLHGMAVLTIGKERQYLLDRRQDGPQGPPGPFERQKVCCPYLEWNSGPHNPLYSTSTEMFFKEVVGYLGAWLISWLLTVFTRACH